MKKAYHRISATVIFMESKDILTQSVDRPVDDVPEIYAWTPLY